MNDALWLGIILEIKKKVKTDDAKALLAVFLEFYSSVFCSEVMKVQMGRLNGKTNITKTDIYGARDYHLKNTPSGKSNDTQAITREMGISFEEYVFDIVLTLNNSKLININLGNWNLYKNIKLADSIVAGAGKFFENSSPELFSQIKKELLGYTDRCADKINAQTIMEKTYSSNKIFKNSALSDDSKLYILKRYGLISNSLFITNILNENICIRMGNLSLDLREYITKTKAIVIGILGEDRKASSLSEFFGIIQEINQHLPEDFYQINRRSRNNLHYEKHNELTETDRQTLQKYQDIYLNNVLAIFDKNLFYKFDCKYEFDLKLAHLAK